MGYSGRVDQTERTRSVVIDEAYRCLNTAHMMVEAIKDIKTGTKQAHQIDYEDLDIRVGLHTGRILAGIIGTKVVKYDIFGEAVMITYKIKQHGLTGQVCISGTTFELLQES
jgi:class 3 adenylate cyclase